MNVVRRNSWFSAGAAALAGLLAPPPESSAQQSLSSSSYRVTTQAAETGGSPVTGSAYALTGGDYAAIVVAGRAGDDLKSTASYRVSEGYIPTLPFAGSGGSVPDAPVITTQSPKKTNDDTPILTGTGASALAVVKIYDGTVLIGSGLASPSGDWQVHATAHLPDGEYDIFAKAFNGGIASEFSSGVSMTIDTTPPPAPQNLVIRAYSGGLDLQWSPSVADDLVGYQIYRKEPEDEEFDLLNPGDVVDGDEEERYVDTDVVNGTLYIYRVVAIDDALDEKHQ